MSAERDELADLIASVTIDTKSGDVLRVHPDGETPVFEGDQRTADALLAAGYRKPQQITTVEELDALPEGTVIRDASGVVRDRFNEPETGAALWLRPGAKGWLLSRNFGDKHFPATVLHIGGAE